MTQLPTKVFYNGAWRDLEQRVQIGGQWVTISPSTGPILPAAPASLVRAWSFAKGANDQLVYESVAGAHGQRGSAAGADAADFAWSDPPAYATFGGDDYGTAPSGLPGGNAAFSLAVLAKGGGSQQRAVSMGAATLRGGLGIAVINDNIAGAIFGEDVFSTNPMGGDWRNIFLTYSGATRVVRLYAGSALIKEQTLAGNLVVPANPLLYFGRVAYAAEAYWNGPIAYVQTYNAALTPAEVASENARIAAEARTLPITLDSLDFPPATATPVAYSATALRESVGVNVHTRYGDTTYYDGPRILSYLQDMGVTRIRDELRDSPYPQELTFLADAAAAGIKTTLVVGDPAGRFDKYGTGEAAQLVASLKDPARYGGGRVHQLEGPNEWDIAGERAANWQQQLKDFYAAYRTAIRADPGLNHLRFAGPSMAHGPNFQTYLDTNQEVAVLHPYPGGRIPEWDGLAQQVGFARASAGAGKPVIATELGYNNATNIAEADGNIGVPEDVQAHYVIRELLYNLYSGITENYIYQLFDEKPPQNLTTDIEESFGAVAVSGSGVKETWTLRKKLVFEAVKRMLAYLVDTGGGSLPTTLPFGVSNVPAGAMVVPIARRDGTFDAAAWLKNPLFDRAARTTVADTTAPLTLHFPAAKNVDAYQPSVGTAKTRVGTGVTTLTVTLNGKVNFLRIS